MKNDTAELRLKIGESDFSAVLLGDEAPKTCAAILSLLPIRGKVVHARWSGESMWMSMDNLGIKVGHENQTSEPAPGELLFYLGFISEKELLIPYGASKFASRAGVLEGNHFATITQGLKGLAEVGRSTLWEGAKDIVVRLA